MAQSLTQWKVASDALKSTSASRKKNWERTRSPVCIIHYQQNKTDSKVQQISRDWVTSRKLRQKEMTDMLPGWPTNWVYIYIYIIICVSGNHMHMVWLRTLWTTAEFWNKGTQQDILKLLKNHRTWADARTENPSATRLRPLLKLHNHNDRCPFFVKRLESQRNNMMKSCEMCDWQTETAEDSSVKEAATRKQDQHILLKVQN